MTEGNSGKMSIKLSVIKTGEHVISDIMEVVSEEGKVCGYKLKDPHVVKLNTNLMLVEQEIGRKVETNEHEVEVSLTPWIILSEDRDVVVTLDSVIAIVNPVTSLFNLYNEKLNLNNLEVISD